MSHAVFVLTVPLSQEINKMLAKQGLFAASGFLTSSVMFAEQSCHGCCESNGAFKVSSLLKSLVLYCMRAFILCGIACGRFV